MSAQAASAARAWSRAREARRPICTRRPGRTPNATGRDCRAFASGRGSRRLGPAVPLPPPSRLQLRSTATARARRARPESATCRQRYRGPVARAVGIFEEMAAARPELRCLNSPLHHAKCCTICRIAGAGAAADAADGCRLRRRARVATVRPSKAVTRGGGVLAFPARTPGRESFGEAGALSAGARGRG
jgi:hypothetical protein